MINYYVNLLTHKRVHYTKIKIKYEKHNLHK